MQSTLRPGATKPDVVVAVVREHATRAGEATVEVPSAAPSHTVVGVLPQKAAGPFPNIPSHILRAIRRTPQLPVPVHRRSALDPALSCVTPLVRELLAPWIAPAVDAARGLLPLLLRGQPFAGPFGIGCRAVPAHIDHRMILIPSLHRESALAPGNPAFLFHIHVSPLEIDPLRALFFLVSALVQELAELRVGHREMVDPKSFADRGHLQIAFRFRTENEQPRGDINHAICKALLIAVLRRYQQRLADSMALLIAVLRRYQVMHEPDDGLIQLACRDLAPQQCLRHLLRHEEFHERLMRELVIPFRIPVQEIADPDLLVETEAA